MKFLVTRECDYVMGHLRYGHLEGVVEADSLEDAKQLIAADRSGKLLDLVIDDYSVEDYELTGNYKFVEIKNSED